ncbi:hypothetical protein D3C84_794240 [compost metagenome]
MPEPRVPLPQGLLQPLPGRKESWFHVEHSPIQKLPTNFRCSFQQSKTVRIDQLQRQGLSQLRSAFGVLPIDSNLKFTLAITRDPEVALPALGEADLPENRTRGLRVLNHWLQARTAE